jgi:uncharacterized protein YrrD
MTTWELKDLLKVPVVSNAAAREIGKVHEALFDPGANALFGLVVSPPEKNSPPMLVLLKEIRAIGKDAISVTGQNIEPFEENTRAKAISAAGGHHSGMNVMTESGESVGKVDKVTLNDDGTVASYHSTTGFFGSKHDIEPSEVISGSEEKLIISDNAREGATRTVLPQGRVPDRAADPDPAPPSRQAVASPAATPDDGVTKPNEVPGPEAAENSSREGVTQGTPDNSMFTSGEIPAREASESKPREAPGDSR